MKWCSKAEGDRGAGSLVQIDASQFAPASPDDIVEFSRQQALKKIALCDHTFVATMKALVDELRDHGKGEGYLISEDDIARTLWPSAIPSSKSLWRQRREQELKIAVVVLALLDWVSWD